MKTWFYADVPETGLIPHRWLGLAWRREVYGSAVYLPVPFNRVARWVLNTWRYLRFPDPSEWDRRFYDFTAEACRKSYERGLDARWDIEPELTARAAAYEKGRADVLAEMLARLDRDK